MDRIKEELALLRILLVLDLATGITLVGWLAQHYQSTSPTLLGFAVFAIVVVLAAMVGMSRAILRRLDRLEDAP